MSSGLARSLVDSIRAPAKAFITIEGGHFTVLMKTSAFLDQLVPRDQEGRSKLLNALSKITQRDESSEIRPATGGRAASAPRRAAALHPGRRRPAPGRQDDPGHARCRHRRTSAPFRQRRRADAPRVRVDRSPVGGGSPAASRQRCAGSASGAGQGAEGPTLVGDRQAALGRRHPSPSTQGRAVGVRAASHPAGDDRKPCRPLRDRPPIALDAGGDAAGVRLGGRSVHLLRRLPRRGAARHRSGALGALRSRLAHRDHHLARRAPPITRGQAELGCAYSGQILSYTKMLGQLQDAGNTTTLAHYLDLLAGAGMLVGLQKHARRAHLVSAVPAPSCRCSTRR